MKVLVCVNQIPDPEAPARLFSFRPGARQPDPWQDAFVMGPFDENALELALQLKDQVGARVYALSLGGRQAAAALRKALTVRADEVIWVQHDAAELDSSGVAAVLAEVGIRSQPAVAVLRPGALPGDGNAVTPGEVQPLAVEVDASAARSTSLGVIAEAGQGVRLEDARLIVSGGRGIGGPEGFAQLGELAAVLGAAVGASRLAVDLGWVPSSIQIGQTGKSVSPNLYLAVGISGASQHLAGIGRAKRVFAINNDAEAPIFETAEVGVVADWQDVLPPLIDELRRRLQ